MRPAADQPWPGLPALVRRALAAPTLADAGWVAAGGVAAALLLDPAPALLATFWAGLVVVVVRSDCARFIIPDEASALIALLGLVGSLVRCWESGGPEPLGQALAGGATGFGLLWLVAWAYRRRTGREGLGFGDVKLAGASGLWLSFAQQAVALELACLAAIGAVLVLHRGRAARRAAVPFGAFFAPAAWLVFVAGPALAERWF